MLLSAEGLFKKANEILHNEQAPREELDHAFDIITALLNNDPQSPLLLFTLGCLSMRKKQHALSIMFYEMAIHNAKSPESSVTSWINLGIIHKLEERHDVALACYKKALSLIPANPSEELKHHFDQCECDAKINISGLFVSAGQPQEGLELMREIEEKWPDRASIANLLSNKSLLLLETGDYAAGFEAYDQVKRRFPQERNYPGEPPLWDGTKGKTVIVTGEQGIGDEIMFASVVPDLMKDCHVVMDSHMRLADLFRRSFDIPVYGTREFNGLRWNHPADYRIPIGSLCKYYRKKKEDFPGTAYLKPDEKLVARLSQRLGDKPRIGISWRGGTKLTNKKDRSLSLKQLLPLLQSIDAQWVSLQYHEAAALELAEFEKETGVHIDHWKDALDNYDMTAALVANLDLVISVPQSVVHLAGALGVPTWQLCPKRAMWQMGPHGEDMPWYKSVKNYWQTELWAPVIEKVTEDLREYVRADNGRISQAERKTA